MKEVIKKFIKKDLLKENDDYYQYQDNGTDSKQFNTPIDKSKIDWNSNDERLKDYDLDYSQNSVINVDWSVIMTYNIYGIKFTPKINAANGFIFLKSYNTKESFKIDISSNKGWKIQVGEYYFDFDNSTLAVERVEVDVDNKVLIFN